MINCLSTYKLKFYFPFSASCFVKKLNHYNIKMEKISKNYLYMENNESEGSYNVTY